MFQRWLSGGRPAEIWTTPRYLPLELLFWNKNCENKYNIQYFQEWESKSEYRRKYFYIQTFGDLHMLPLKLLFHITKFINNWKSRNENRRLNIDLNIEHRLSLLFVGHTIFIKNTWYSEDGLLRPRIPTNAHSRGNPPPASRTPPRRWRIAPSVRNSRISVNFWKVVQNLKLFKYWTFWIWWNLIPPLGRNAWGF